MSLTWRERWAARLDARLLRASRPLGDPDLARRTLVLAPHPDDETLGCGGTIARLRALGTQVTVVVAADGSRSHRHLMPVDELRARRDAELLAACGELGVGASDVVRLGIEDGTLREHVAAIADAVATLVRERGIERLCMPVAAERIADHVAVHAAGRAVVQRLAALQVFEYPVWFWHVWPFVHPEAYGVRARLRAARESLAAWRGLHRLDRRVELGPARALKLNALARHETQTRRVVDDPRWATLSDVAEGSWLARLLGPNEFFAVTEPRFDAQTAQARDEAPAPRPDDPDMVRRRAT